MRFQILSVPNFVAQIACEVDLSALDSMALKNRGRLLIHLPVQKSLEIDLTARCLSQRNAAKRTYLTSMPYLEGQGAE